MTDIDPPMAFIGCDVGKVSIVVFDSRDATTRTMANEPTALAEFVATLDASCLVICEATGGYEADLLEAVCAAGRAVHRADARKVKAFIRSLGTLGKSDAIDARALARYGEERHDRLTHWQPRDADRLQLQTLVLTRRELVRQRVACSNRLAAPGTEPVAERLQRIRAALDQEIAGIEADIAQLINQSPVLTRAVTIVRTLRGFGATVAAAVVALMPELGTIGRRQAAALAGLAPHPNQSGSADRYRRTRGGRPDVKQILFMAAMTAARSDPRMKAFYQRLVGNGKKPLVALTAVMRKMIVIANARLRDDQLTN